MGLRVVANPGEIPWDFRAALASNLTMFNGAREGFWNRKAIIFKDGWKGANHYPLVMSK